jgi:pilus assembly protein CpaD
MSPNPPTIAVPARRAAILLALLMPAAGCSNVDRAVATAAVPADYHQRHPVALVNGRRSLDVFLLGNADRLDYRQKDDVAAFAADFLARGEGRIQVLVPKGPVDGRAVAATLTAVRRGLAGAGVTGSIEVGSYPVADARLAAVVRLSYVALQTRATTHCGDWPADVVAGPTLGGWDNGPYDNFGCATQSTLAAQIDDPRDLVRPRAEQPGDVLMRTRAIGDLRGDPALKGIDPSTAWTQSELVPIGGAR